MSPNRNDYMMATWMRVDPERLAAVRRAISGVTRCPRCDEPNPAAERLCHKCGATLYPDLEGDEKRERERSSRKARKRAEKR